MLELPSSSSLSFLMTENWVRRVSVSKWKGEERRVRRGPRLAQLSSKSPVGASELPLKPSTFQSWPKMGRRASTPSTMEP
jgi:hypothetical protein